MSKRFYIGLHVVFASCCRLIPPPQDRRDGKDSMKKTHSLSWSGIARLTMAVLPTLPVLAFGIAMCLFAGLGADVTTSFEQGLGRKVGLETGTVNLIFNTLVLVIFCFADRSLVGIGSFLVGFGLGPFMNLFESLLHTLIPVPPVLAIRILLSLSGTVLTCLALAWYVQIGQGVQPLDMINLTLSRLLKRSYGTGMYMWSAIALALTLLFRGDFGIGTFLNLLLGGFLCDLFIPLLRPAVRRLCGPYWKGDQTNGKAEHSKGNG